MTLLVSAEDGNVLADQASENGTKSASHLLCLFQLGVWLKSEELCERRQLQADVNGLSCGALAFARRLREIRKTFERRAVSKARSHAGDTCETEWGVASVKQSDQTDDSRLVS